MLNNVTIYKKQAVFMACFTLIMVVASQAFAQSDLYNRLTRAERDIETLSRAVYKGEELPASMTQGVSEEKKFRADTQVRMSDIENEVRSLRGQLEEYQNSVDILTRKVEALEARGVTSTSQSTTPAALEDNNSMTYEKNVVQSSQDTSLQGQTLQDQRSQDQALQDQEQATASLNSQGNDSALDVYQNAFSLLKDGDNPAAEQAFSSFIQNYPNSDLVDNARYWLGEAYYVQNDFGQAARTFAEAYQKAPQGVKAADNLLKLGLSLAGLGRVDDACVSFEQLNKEFGGTSSAIIRRGEQESQKLGCE